MIHREAWYREITGGEGVPGFDRVVADYEHSEDWSDLMRVLQLSLRSGVSLPGIRSMPRVKARSLLLDRILDTLRRDLPDTVTLETMPPFPAPFGMVGPQGELTLPTRFRREREVKLRVYPLIQPSLEAGEPMISLTNLSGGRVLGINFTGTFSLPEIVQVLSGVLP